MVEIGKIAGLRPATAATRVSFANALNGIDGEDRKKKKKHGKKPAQVGPKKLAKQLEDLKILQQNYELQKAKAAQQEIDIKQNCGAEIAAYRDASKTYESYLSGLQNKYYEKAKQGAIENINKTRTGGDRDFYIKTIGALKPSDFSIQTYFSEDETKTLSAYDTAAIAAKQALNGKLSAFFAQTNAHPAKNYIFSYINNLNYQSVENKIGGDNQAIRPK